MSCAQDRSHQWLHVKHLIHSLPQKKGPVTRLGCWGARCWLLSSYTFPTKWTNYRSYNCPCLCGHLHLNARLLCPSNQTNLIVVCVRQSNWQICPKPWIIWSPWILFSLHGIFFLLSLVHGLWLQGLVIRFGYGSKEITAWNMSGWVTHFACYCVTCKK